MSTAENDLSPRRFALLGGDDGVWSIAGLAFRSDRAQPAREARQVRYRNALAERSQQRWQGAREHGRPRTRIVLACSAEMGS